MKEKFNEAFEDIKDIRNTLHSLDKNMAENNIILKEHEKRISNLEQETKGINKKITYVSGIFAGLVYFLERFFINK